jgi:mycothiol synthase
MDLGLRPITRDDIDAIVELAEVVAAVDDPDGVVSRDHVAAQFEIPGIDITQAIWVLPGDDGKLIASVAALALPTDDEETVHISCDVVPSHRGVGLEERLLRFAEERAQAARRLHDLPGSLHAGIRAANAERAALLEAMGYEPVRWFQELERPLDGDIAGAPMPDGLVATTADGDSDLDDAFRALGESFKDHWHQSRFTVEQYRHFYSMMAQAPIRLLLARDADGEPAGVCIARVSDEKNAQRGTREGEVVVLGVCRPYRRRGLARALLLSILAWLREVGMEMATIGVDADSPTGANRLYESVGFSERRTAVVYRKPMP